MKINKENKQKERIKQIIKYALFIVALMLIIATHVLATKFGNLDEIWNFNMSRCTSNGLLPYKDFNIIQMPGLFIITAIFLNIANQLIVTRILAILLATAIMFVAFKILKKLQVNENLAMLLIIGITYIFLEYFCLDYNFLNLLILVIVILLEIKNADKNDFKYNFLTGILVGFSILIKQTTGAFIIMAFGLYKLICINKKNYKEIIKALGYRVLGVFVPILLLVIYLTVNNIWIDFIDYTILGMFTFSNKIAYSSLIESDLLHIKILSIVVPICFIIMLIRFIVKREKKYLVFLLYSLAGFIVVYPISDNIHFLIGALPAIIGIIYLMYEFSIYLIHKFLKARKKMFIKLMLECAICLLCILIIVEHAIQLQQTINEIKEYTELSHFKYIPISEGLKEQISLIDEYIIKYKSENKKIYILDASAVIYMIPIDIYNKDYDMFLKGNIGGAGEERSD